MSHFTSIYGLTLRLNRVVPGISVLKGEPHRFDVDIHFGSMPDWFYPPAIDKSKWYVSPAQREGEEPRLVVWDISGSGHYHFRYADDTQFLLDKQGTKVWATWPAETLTLEDTATYLLGPMMGFLLLLRGCVSLHASAIAIGNKAIAIVGPAGSGKSTTAAAFADLGFRVLAEDVVSLKDFADHFLVHPAYPCIRLWPSSVKALYGEEAELPRLTPTWDKCYLDLAQEQYNFATEPLPLSAIYLLDARSEAPTSPSVHALRLSEGLISLVANTYATYLMDREMRAREFELLNRLLRYVPINRVVPHADLANIRALCQVIVDNFTTYDSKKVILEGQEQLLHV